MISIADKISYLLDKKQKKELLILGLALIFGVFLETVSLGIVVPILSIIFNTTESTQVTSIIEAFAYKFNFHGKSEMILFCLIVLLSVYIIKTFFLIFLNWKQSKFSSNLSANLSNRLFDGYLRLPYSFHLNRNSAELIRNLQSEIIQFTEVSRAIMYISSEISIIIGIIITLLYVEPFGAFSVGAFILISSALFMKIVRNKILHWGEQRQNYDGYLSQHLMQGLNGIKDVKLLGKEWYFGSLFTNVNNKKSGILTKQYTLLQVPRLYLELVAIIGLSILILIFSIFSDANFGLVFPTLGLFVAAAFRLIPSANKILNSSQTIRSSRPVINLLYSEFKIINQNTTSNQRISNEQFNFSESIIVENLNFKYSSAETFVLKDIDFEIKKGECVGFIGESGSGKSTLIDIIIGLLEPSSGQILVDKRPISDNMRSWQENIGYVSQSIYLTDDTIRNNIAFGVLDNEINEFQLVNALKSAQLYDYVISLPDGLDTLVGERGVRLSGGQKQRIGIARALYHNPKILVLDEATSALDTATEEEVMKSVYKLEDKTILIIAHRLSTLNRCHRVLKLYKNQLKMIEIN